MIILNRWHVASIRWLMFLRLIHEMSCQTSLQCSTWSTAFSVISKMPIVIATGALEVLPDEFGQIADCASDQHTVFDSLNAGAGAHNIRVRSKDHHMV